MKRSPKPIAVNVRRLASAAGLPLPSYQTDQSAGMDLIAAIPANEALTLQPGSRALVPTGLCIELPVGSEAQVRPRSGLAAKHGVTVLNSPGTIDADYRGEIQVILINHGDDDFKIHRGDRIAQLVFASLMRCNLRETAELKGSARGAGGFGSTGIAVTKTQKKTPVARKRPIAKTASAKRSSRTPRKSSAR